METESKSSARANELYDLARALQEQGRPCEALVYYEKVVELEPRKAAAFCKMGDACCDLG
jgi:tetratricopeptide (TPR) repeat protein